MPLARLAVKVGTSGKAGPHAAYIAREGKYAGFGQSPSSGDETQRAPERLEAKGHGNMPAWASRYPSEFWKASDIYERVNGSTYREMEISLPRELNSEQRLALVHEWIAQELGDRHAYQYAIHVPQASDGKDQPHVHLMFSERQLDGIERDPEQYFKRYNAKNPERGGARKGFLDAHGPSRHADRAALLKALRHRWEVACNDALERAGRAERIDMRSNAERGLDLPVERKFKPSEWRYPETRSNVIAFRAARVELKEALDDIERSIPDIEAAIIDLQQARLKRAEARRKAEQDRVARGRLQAMGLDELRALDAELQPWSVEQLIERLPHIKQTRAEIHAAHRAEAQASLATDAVERQLGEWRAKHPLRNRLHEMGWVSSPEVTAMQAALSQAQQDRIRASEKAGVLSGVLAEQLTESAGAAQIEHVQMVERHAFVRLELEKRLSNLPVPAPIQPRPSPAPVAFLPELRKAARNDPPEGNVSAQREESRAPVDPDGLPPAPTPTPTPGRRRRR